MISQKCPAITWSDQGCWVVGWSIEKSEPSSTRAEWSWFPGTNIRCLFFFSCFFLGHAFLPFLNFFLGLHSSSDSYEQDFFAFSFFLHSFFFGLGALHDLRFGFYLWQVFLGLHSGVSDLSEQDDSLHEELWHDDTSLLSDPLEHSESSSLQDLQSDLVRQDCFLRGWLHFREGLKQLLFF